MELSTSALIDGLIHLAAFLVVCGTLYAFLMIVGRGRFESNFFRTMFVVVTLITARLYLLRMEWATTAFSVLILVMLSVVLLVSVLKTDLILTVIAPFVMVGLLLGMEKAAFSISKKIISDGVTFADFTGQAQAAIERSKRSAEQSRSSDVDVRDVARRGMDALASLTTKQAMDAMKDDFSRGASLFAERKEWMDSLSPAEKRAYREEMSAFLAEQGIAEDRYSLNAIREVNPTNLVVLASLFDDLQNNETAERERIRSIPESLSAIAANLRGVELSGDDLETLQAFSELFARDESEEAIVQARKDLEESGGADEVAGMVLAAMLQSKSGLPMDQFVDDAETTGLFAPEYIDPPAGPTIDMVVEADDRPVILEEAEPIPPDQSKPFVEISCPLGIVQIPPDLPGIDDWIAAAQALEIKGYASLGGEVAILRKDGSVCVKGDDLALEYGDLTYHFKVVSVVRDRVVLQTGEVELRDWAAGPYY